MLPLVVSTKLNSMEVPAPVIAAHQIITDVEQFKKSPRAMLQGLVMIDQTIDDLDDCEALPEIMRLDYISFLQPIRAALAAAWKATSLK